MTAAQQTLANGLRIQRSVIRALFHREIKTRYSGYRLGFFWAFLGPLAHIGTFLLMFGLGGRGLSNGPDFPLFLVTGFLPYFLFNDIYSHCMSAPDGNQGLFAFRQVRPIDTILARTLVEVFLSAISVIIILTLFAWFGLNIIPVRPLECLLAFALLGLLGLGLGMIFAAAVTLFHELNQIIPLLMRPFYFISGIMWNVALLPLDYQGYFTWNPILHALELIREGFFANYNGIDASLGYLTFCTTVVLFLGFSLYSIHWKKMIKV